MKNILMVCTLIYIFTLGSKAQGISGINPFSAKNSLVPTIDIGIGYVPGSDIRAARISLAANNLVLDRFGLYTAAESNFESSYFSHLLGFTGSVNHFSYVYAGFDWFTRYGLLTKKGLKGVRKEIGVGFYPVKWTAIKAGYSFSVGLYGELGIRIPLK